MREPETSMTETRQSIEDLDLPPHLSIGLRVAQFLTSELDTHERSDVLSDSSPWADGLRAWCPMSMAATWL